jgi:hypothetical protein
MTLPLPIMWTAPCGNGWPPTASGAPGPQNLTATRSKSAAPVWVVPRWGGLCGTQVATGRTETAEPAHEEWQTRYPRRKTGT